MDAGSLPRVKHFKGFLYFLASIIVIGLLFTVSRSGQAASMDAPTAESFTLIGTGMQPVEQGTVAWGDYDNDGDLDALVSGSGSAIIYRNNNGTFVNIGAPLPGVVMTTAVWGDMNNDGYLDILYGGSGGIFFILNNSGSSFTYLGNCGLPGIASGALALADFDRDADLDILLTGYGMTLVFRNNGGFSFANVALSGVPGVSNSAAAWGDYDNDGDLDAVVGGAGGTFILRNENGTSFTYMGPSGLPSIASGSLAWGDYDNDDDLDLLITGSGLAKVYRNSSGSFADAGIVLPNLSYSTAAWGDFDYDGDLDITLSGWDGGVARTAIYQNSAGAFADTGVTLAPLLYSSIAWGDYDNDGDLDLLLAGRNGNPGGGSPGTYLYRNDRGSNTFAPNNVPAAPTNPTFSYLSDSSVRLAWNAASDAQTESAGLTYNLRVSTSPGGINIVSPMANTSTGRRLVAQIGPANHGLSAILSGLSAGTYYWSVQAVDNAFAGSAFSTEGTFILPQFGLNASLTGIERGAGIWGDYDNDGDLDVFFNGPGVAKLFRNNSGSFVDSGLAFPILSGNYIHASWADYDNDNDLDLFLLGGGAVVAMNNNGLGAFSNIGSLGLSPAQDGLLAWGDFDNDGDLDAFEIGYSGDYLARIYRNDSGSFTNTGFSLPVLGLVVGSADWGDYDNDGDLDVIVTGNYRGTAYIFLVTNRGNGSFASSVPSISPVYQGSIAWGDYDNDDDLDILISGLGITTIYRNTNGAFSDASSGLPGMSYSSVAWGDYDADGDLDLALAGWNGSAAQTLVYKNVSGSFVNVSANNLTGLLYSAIAWGDYDNDGDLDILTTGRNGNPSSGTPTTVIYRNNLSSNVYTINTLPAAPGNLNVSVAGNIATFTWAAASDSQTPANGLSYNLRLGTVSGGFNIVSPMSNLSTGYRRSVRFGNSGSSSAAMLKNLPPGVYYWSVQAIDSALAGGPFAAEGSFVMPDSFADVSTSLNNSDGVGLWGDFNNDRNLDVLVSGSTSTQLHRNTSGTFSLSASFPSRSGATAAWGDLDYNGWLDMIISGGSGTRVYMNSGGGFSDYGSMGLPTIINGAIAVGDADQDGDLDLVLAGNGWASLARNNSGSSFTILPLVLPDTPSLYEAAADLGDYDQDGDLDILLAGYDTKSGSNKTYILRNDGALNFVSLGSLGLPGIRDGAVEWGDFDNDQDLDILITGANLTRVYRNTEGTFSDIGAGLPDLSYSSAAWGDFDSDGDLDIALTGWNGSSAQTSVFINTAGAFADGNMGLQGMLRGTVAWGDFENDGDLDLLVTGLVGTPSSGTPTTKLYRNNRSSNTYVTNTVPAAPANLNATVNGHTVTLSWDAVSGDQTPANGLTYNLQVGTTPNGWNIVASMSNWSSGVRRVVNLGNAFHNTSAFIQSLAAGTYYWKVQALDGAFAGGAFSTEGSFIIEDAPIADFSASPTSGYNPLEVTFTNLTTGEYSSLEWDFGDGSPTSSETNPIHIFARGEYTVTLTADGIYGSDTMTKVAYIHSLNNPPSASTYYAITDEDTPVSSSLSASDSDGDDLTFSKASDPTHGTAEVSAAGVFTYTPALNYYGADVFEFSVSDGHGGSTQARVNITIDPVNEAWPIADDQAISTDEDVRYNGILTASDGDGDILSFSRESGPAHGSVLIQSNGRFDYTPAANYNGEDSFTFLVDDGYGGTDTGTVSITVNPVNDAPTVSDSSKTTAEDTSLTFTQSDFSSQFTDIEGSPMTGVRITSLPTHGTLKLRQDAGWVLVPSPTTEALYCVDMVSSSDGWAVGGSGTILHWDGHAWSLFSSPTTQTLITIEMLSATDGWIIGTSGTILRWNGVNWSIFSSPTSDNLFGLSMVSDTDGWAVGSNGRIIHWDGTSWSIVSSPTSNRLDDISMFSATEGLAVGEYGAGAHWNGVNWSYVSTGVGGTMQGVKMLSATNGWAAGDWGNLRRWNGSAWVAGSTPSLTTMHGLDMDSASDGWFVGDSGITWHWNGSTWALINAPASGSLYDVSYAPGQGVWAVSAAGEILFYRNTEVTLSLGEEIFAADLNNLVFIPEADFYGTTTFTWMGSDDAQYSNEATLSIHVTPVNDAPPVATDQSITLDEDVPYYGLLTATDYDNDELTFSNSSGPAHGALQISASGAFTYTPSADYNGADSFTFLVDDGYGGTDTGTVSITVNPVNDAPVANDDFGSGFITNEDTPFTLADVLANDSDLEGNLLYLDGYDDSGLLGLLTYIHGSTGALDTTFDGDGFVVTNLGGNDYAWDMALQTDGKILVAGTTNSDDFALARFNTNGSLDTGFSGDGIVTTNIGGQDAAYALVLQPDGKIVLAGQIYTGDTNFALARYNPDGSLDTSFDSDGIVITDMGGHDHIFALALQPDGKIVAAGYSYVSDISDFALARYNPDGSLDTSFDGDGRLKTNFGGNETPEAMILQPDGKIVAVGYANAGSGYDVALARYNSDGSLDTTFDGDGMLTTDFGSEDAAVGAVLQPDGRIVVVGHTNSNNFILARYNTDGSLDTSFDGDGKLTTDFGATDIGTEMVLQPDGKILVVGYTGSSGVYNFALARYNPDGSLDTSFDGDGKLITDLGGNDYAQSVALQADGRIIVAGHSNVDFAVVCYGPGSTFYYDPNGQFEWLAVGEVTTDTFTYVASDGFLTDTATINITINGINDAPTADDQSVVTDEDTAYEGTLTGSDIDGDSLSYAKASDPAHGSVIVAPSGVFTYTPAADYNGADSFTFLVDDGHSGTDTGTVSITVNPPPATCTSTGSTNWSLSSTWDCGHVPRASDDVVIASGHTVPLDIPGNASQLTIDGTLSVVGSNNLHVYRNWTNNGAFDPASGAVYFSGSTTIGGSSVSSFFDVFIEVASSLTAPSGSMNVAGDWTNNGTFDPASGAVHFSGSTIIGGSSVSSFFDIFLEAASSLTAPSENMNVAGDWINEGTFIPSSGTVAFNGTSPQTLGGSQITGFNNLTVNSNATLVLDTEPTVESSLTNNGTLQQTLMINGGWSDVSSGDGHSCGLTTSGEILCWGRNTYGQLNVPAGYNWTQMDAGSEHSCGLTDNNQMLCWGYGGYGQLNIPAGYIWVQVSTGYLLTCGITDTGAMRCWGNNNYGQSNVPGGYTWAQTSPANDHTCGLTTSGGAVCWGINDWGQSNVPGGYTWTQISAGGQHTCGITNTGAMLCWGRGDFGQLSVPAGYTWAQTSAGYAHVCGVTTSGELLCWGRNDFGQINRPTGYTWALVDAGITHTCGITTGGETLCWGDSSNGKTTPLAAGVSTRFLHLTNAVGVVDQYYGVDIAPNNAGLGSTTVTIRGNQPACNVGDQLIHRCFDIDSEFDQPATVRFWYLDGEKHTEIPADMKVYHWNGSGWDRLDAGNEVRGTADGDYHYVQVAGVGEFSPFGLSDGDPGTPTAVELVSLRATRLTTGTPSIMLVILLGIVFASGCWWVSRKR